jgi:hypothetical protein
LLCFAAASGSARGRGIGQSHESVGIVDRLRRDHQRRCYVGSRSNVSVLGNHFVGTNTDHCRLHMYDGSGQRNAVVVGNAFDYSSRPTATSQQRISF